MTCMTRMTWVTRMIRGVAGVCVLLTYVSLGAVPAYAQGAKLQLDALNRFADRAAEVVDIGVDTTLLQLASRLFSDSQPDEATIKELLSAVKGIYVKRYKFNADGVYQEADVDAVRRQLAAPGWSRMVQVLNKPQGEMVEVYSRVENGKTTGHAIIAAEPRELTVVNIIGSIDLAKLSALEGQFGIPRLPTGKRPPDEEDR